MITIHMDFWSGSYISLNMIENDTDIFVITVLTKQQSIIDIFKPNSCKNTITNLHRVDSQKLV